MLPYEDIEIAEDPWMELELNNYWELELKNQNPNYAKMLKLQGDGYKYQEIADIMGVSKETVRKGLYRIRTKLKKEKK